MSSPGPVSRVSSAPPSRGSPGLAPLLAFGPLAFVAERILVTTHHRPLGAVTFAFVAVVVYVVCELFVRLALSDDARLETLASLDARSGGRAGLRRATWVVAAVGSACAVLHAL